MVSKLYLVVKEENWDGVYKWGVNLLVALYSDKNKAENVARDVGGKIVELEVDSGKWELIYSWTEVEEND